MTSSAISAKSCDRLWRRSRAVCQMILAQSSSGVARCWHSIAGLATARASHFESLVLKDDAVKRKYEPVLCSVSGFVPDLMFVRFENDILHAAIVKVHKALGVVDLLGYTQNHFEHFQIYIPS